MELVDVRCPICGSGRCKVLYPDSVRENNDGILRFRQSDPNNTTRRIVKCEVCGLVYTSPREDEETLERIYLRVEDNDYLKEQYWKIKTLKFNKKILECYKDGGRLLDVGCGHGFFLDILDGKWDGFGIDPAISAVNIARQKGHRAFVSTLENAPFKSDYFDCITVFHVLEHVSDPKRFLKKANQLLKDDGLIYLEVPDFGSAIARLFKRHWWYIMRFHTYYFTRRTLDKILRKTGFEPLTWLKPTKTWGIKYITWKLIHFGKPFKIIYEIVELLPLSKISITIKAYDQIGVVARKVRS